VTPRITSASKTVEMDNNRCDKQDLLFDLFRARKHRNSSAHRRPMTPHSGDEDVRSGQKQHRRKVTRDISGTTSPG